MSLLEKQIQFLIRQNGKHLWAETYLRHRKEKEENNFRKKKAFEKKYDKSLRFRIVLCPSKSVAFENK